MKRWFSFVLSAVLLLGLVACGGLSSDPNGAGQPDNGEAQQTIEPVLESTGPNNGLPDSDTQAPNTPGAGNKSVVYMTTDISPEDLMAVYIFVEHAIRFIKRFRIFSEHYRGTVKDYAQKDSSLWRG